MDFHISYFPAVYYSCMPFMLQSHDQRQNCTTKLLWFLWNLRFCNFVEVCSDASTWQGVIIATKQNGVRLHGFADRTFEPHIASINPFSTRAMRCLFFEFLRKLTVAPQHWSEEIVPIFYITFWHPEITVRLTTEADKDRYRGVWKDDD